MMIPRKDTITMIGINRSNKTKKIVTAICTAKYITVTTTEASIAAAATPGLPAPVLFSSMSWDNFVCVFILWLSIAVFFCCSISLKFSAVFFATSAASPAPVDAVAVSAVFAAAFPAAFAVSVETEGEAISAAFSPPATVLWERIAARLFLDFDAISPFPPWLPISFLSTGSFHVFDLYFLSFEKIFAACFSFS